MGHQCSLGVKVFKQISHLDLLISVTSFVLVQKQPPEVLFKKRCSLKLRNIYRRATVFGSLFKRPANILKRDFNTGVSCKIRKNF